MIALRNIKNKTIKLIEEHFNANFEQLFTGLFDYYKLCRPFTLLPGHHVIIQNIPELLGQTKSVEKSLTNTSNDFSFVMKWLIETAEKNAGRGHPKMY